MKNFSDIKLNENIAKSLDELGFISPTPIQSKTIPLLLDTKQDLIGAAQTGTGKTAAFGIPSIHLTDISDKSVQTLILCPTRELCIQITKDLKKYSKYVKGVQIVPVYGGASMETQIRALKKGSQIVVGTPGRTKDMIKRKKLSLVSIDRVVLDEADEMLSMGFKEDLDFILSKATAGVQKLLFSATMPKKVTSIIKNYIDSSEQSNLSQFVEILTLTKLKTEGNNLYRGTPGSGLPVYGLAVDGKFGQIEAGFLENSNVKITDELIKMIQFQQAFTGNSRLLQTEIEITDKLLNR